MKLEKRFDFAKASNAFYEELFRLFPEMEDRFEHVRTQKDMFETAFRTIILNRADNEELQKYLKILGDRHKMRGLYRVHMLRGHTAFLEAIHAGCPDVTDEEMDDLNKTYKILVDCMGYDTSGLDI